MKKKLLLIGACISICFLSCTNIVITDDYKRTSSIVLPNGNTLNNSELTYLKKLSDKHNFSRQCGSEDNKDIDTMIQILHDELGDDAQKYYGKTVISNKIIPISNNSRALEINMSDDSVIAWVNATITKYWGPWWCYVVFDSDIVCQEKDYNVTKKIKLDATYYDYEDSVTSKFSNYIDWSYLDNPSNIPNTTKDQNGFMSGSDFKKALDWDIANATRTQVHIQGNTMYGFFPQISFALCNVTYYDNLFTFGDFSFFAEL